MAIIKDSTGQLIENPNALPANFDMTGWREITADEWKLYVLLTSRIRSLFEEHVCLACGADFEGSGARLQHIWDNRNDDFEIHGNENDVAAQRALED